MAGVDDIEPAQEQSLAARIKNFVGYFTPSQDCQEPLGESQAEEAKEFACGDSNEEDEREVCKFFLEGKCRFGNTCFNRHPEGFTSLLVPKNDPKKTGSAKRKSKDTKKRSMKTAMDVIHRIQWDESLPAEFFVIGYLDRFKGIVEENFQSFSSWGDLPNAEYDALAIPQHRIQYFKYKDTIVWDKAQKLDCVFGSTGAATPILKLLDQIDERIEREQLEKRRQRDNEESDSSLSDSDSDDDTLQVNIDPIAMDNNRLLAIPEMERSTHFLAIRITDSEIKENVRLLQQQIVEKEEALGECCMKLGLLHITLGMLRLSDDSAIAEMISVVEDLKPTLKNYADQLKLVISGLDTFGQRVLYAKVKPQPREDLFWEFVSAVSNRVAATSDNVIVTNKFEFQPHVTVAKVSRPIARLRRSKYIPSGHYDDFEEMTFGEQTLDNLQLCVIEATTRFDGFYRTLIEVLADE